MKLNDKYRPKTFEEMIGNLSLKKSLPVLLLQKDNPHSFLFSGDRGSGKTTTARIACSILNIDPANIHELDFADKDVRGIAGASQIKQLCKFRGFGNKSIAIIGDEAHQVTKDFANSMLKLLEEPPEYVYFFFCTTEPFNLIDTILSRCTQYQVERPTERVMTKHLKYICEQEKFNIDFDMLTKIATAGELIPRDCIKLLEQVAPLTDNIVEMELLLKKGITADDEVDAFELAKALVYNPNWNKAKALLENIKNEQAEGIRHLILDCAAKAILKTNGNRRLSDILYEFRDPFYNSGKAGLTRAVHDCLNK